MSHLVTLYEELSMNAQPCHQTELYYGWLLRFADGYTNRANSVNCLYPAPAGPSLEERVLHCRERYARLGLPSVFKLTPASPPELDSILDAMGYRMATPSEVLSAPLEGTGSAASPLAVEIGEGAPARWQEAYLSLSGTGDPVHRRAAGRMLGDIRRLFFSAAAYDGEGRPAACGLCVVEGEYAGLFDIVTHPRFRRRGLARAVCTALLERAASLGAATGYLQMMAANSGARALYASLGFSTAYRYWYRVFPLDGGEGRL